MTPELAGREAVVTGHFDGWKNGRMEEWKNGRLEEWEMVL
jgi:hypothetical protein